MTPVTATPSVPAVASMQAWMPDWTQEPSLLDKLHLSVYCSFNSKFPYEMPGLMLDGTGSASVDLGILEPAEFLQFVVLPRLAPHDDGTGTDLQWLCASLATTFALKLVAPELARTYALLRNRAEAAPPGFRLDTSSECRRNR